MRIGVDNAGRECLRVQKSVELCEKVWNFSIASHTTTLVHSYTNDSHCGPCDSDLFSLISHSLSSVDQQQLCVYCRPRC